MIAGGSRRGVMSLLQNFVLRNSIDRALLGNTTSNVTAVPDCSLFGIRAFSRAYQCERQMSTKTPTEEQTSDQESLEKLNALKEALQSKNEYFEKYKDKFKNLEKSSPRELLARLEQLDDMKRDHVKRLKSIEEMSRKPQTLNDVMHMDSLKNLEREDIVYLWQEFHRHKEGLLAAVMSSAVYDKMAELASVHKMFVMPLPRADGYEFFFMQFENNTFHFTPLIMYQQHRDSAPMALRLINYIDLKSSKDLVLLRGEYDPKCLKAEDAHFLAVQTNFYFGETNDSRLGLLKSFTTTPATFQHTDLIDELRKIQETHAHLFEFKSSTNETISS